MTASLKDYTDKIKKLTDDGKVWIRSRHIERDRRWREITEADVRNVLENGSVNQVRQSDETIFWRGRDTDGRLLEVQCSLVDDEGDDTLVIKDANLVRIGTAYDPTKNDDQIKNDWLNKNPDYELAPGGKVQKKITFTKI